jgi:hypothetical protein
LFILSVISAILVLPYALTLESSALSKVPLQMPIIILLSIIQSSVIFAIAVFFGNILARKIGFGLPLFEAWFTKKKIAYKRTAVISIVFGIAVGIVIFLLDKAFPPLSSFTQPPLWQGFLGSFYGAIGEEVLMRFFLMSLLIFIITKLSRRKAPNSFIIWSSIILIAVLFGLGHLPITSTFSQINVIVILRAVILNGIGGIVFGWLYWKRGLESAMLSHFSADLILQFIIPLIGM